MRLPSSTSQKCKEAFERRGGWWKGWTDRCLGGFGVCWFVDLFGFGFALNFVLFLFGLA